MVGGVVVVVVGGGVVVVLLLLLLWLLLLLMLLPMFAEKATNSFVCLFVLFAAVSAALLGC